MRWTIAPISIAVALMFIFANGAMNPSVAMAQDKGLESLRETGLAFRSVAKKVSPAVVFIKVESEVKGQNSGESFSPYGGPSGDEFFQRFFGAPQQQRPNKAPRKHMEVGQGSGFLITPDGYILTNNHVVGNSDRVSVQLLDGREYKAEIVGTDPGSDLAVIKVDETDLPFLQLGDSEKLEVGDWVLAVGNPFGLSHTLTAGVVSAKGRSGMGLNDYEDFIQTDAAINPGNSGGPLVNLDGDVVGINTAIFSRSGGYMGIGFAIPVNMAKIIRDQLIEHGEVRRGRLGVYIQDMTHDLAESFGLKKAEGILVTQVIEGSPAEDAGLERGDVIVQIDSSRVDDVAMLRNRISLTNPGTEVRLSILRDGEKKDVIVVIGKLDADKADQPEKAGEISSIGLSLHQLSPELAQRFGYENEEGVLVAEVERGSMADRAGIKSGSLILEINQHPVSTVDEARRLLKEGAGKAQLLLVQQGSATQYVVLKPE
jgi:serine protease Do